MRSTTARVATAAAGAALALALAACSSSATTGGSSSDPNTITLAATTNEQPAMTAAIEAFKKANPGVDVKATYSALDQYQTTTRTQLSSGTAPDVVFVWPGDGNPMAMKTVAGANFLKDLSGESFASKLPDAVKKVAQIDGKTYIAPITFSGIGAVYNEGALTEAGPERPDHLERADPVLLRRQGQGQGRVCPRRRHPLEHPADQLCPHPHLGLRA